ncbi:MAG: ABC transporter substrate-binding protein [Deltaproteobacteria bacterium]|uniref:Thiamine pyrimidine synthase n=1 Tax=Candidatus Zymogenus saltonus TaxID=2844893 RepID=A0A9D8KGS5_9DELT|nr:ABC transporter substrate-binding protein [Candidatus Zymogenus saltonus]
MRTTVFKISAFLTLMLFLFSCRSGRIKGPPDEVTVQLKWIHQAQFAGFYVAERKGFYSEENISVTLNSCDPTTSPDSVISDLITGKTDFAVVGGDFFLQTRSMGKPVVAVAVLFQRNPRVYVTMKDSGIVNPQDFVGKKLMVPPDALVQHNALIRKLGIDRSSITIVPFERNTKPLTTGLIDAHMMYRTGLALAFEEEGYETNFIWVENYGIRLYGDTIVTTERIIKENPDLVLRFLRATLRGWRYAIENPEEAVDMTVEYNVKLSRFRQLRMMQVQMPLIHTGKEEIGWMNKDVWVVMQDILLGKDTIDIDKAFNVLFLNEIYGTME